MLQDKFHGNQTIGSGEEDVCGSPKQRPRTSSIVPFIFYVWSFEISRNIL